MDNFKKWLFGEAFSDAIIAFCDSIIIFIANQNTLDFFQQVK